MRNNKKSFRLLIVTVLVLLVGAATYAFTASNTVGNSSAGSGSGTVSGYTVSNISYTIDPTDATKLSQVAFTLDVAATAVKVKLGATTYPCVVSGGTSVTCNVSGADAAINPLASLFVTAVS